MWRFLTRAWTYLVPSDEDMELRLGDTLPKSLKELSDRHRQIEENRVIARDALERVHRNCTTSHLRRGA